MTEIAIDLAAKAGAGLLKAAPWIAGAAVLLAAGAVIDRKAPFFGADAAITRLTADRDAWKANAATYRAAWSQSHGAFLQSEKLRGAETAQARNAAQADADSCKARLAQASKSAAAIRSIVNPETAHAPSGPADPSLVPVDQLRDALQPGASR